MERISIFNYEAFYLDYLEGKLSKGDVDMLRTFFEEYPECRLEDNDLPTLIRDNSVVFENKASLMQTDDNAAITLENVEHFLIAEAEGVLRSDKQSELNAFIVTHPDLEKDRARYGTVYLSPDNSITFSEKASLKRKKTIVLWPYIAGAVAAAIVAFVFLMNGMNNVETPVNVIAEKEVESPEIKEEKGTTPIRERQEKIVHEELPSYEVQRVALVEINDQPKKKDAQDAVLPKLTRRSAAPLLSAIGEQELRPITAVNTAPAKEMNPQQVYASVGFGEMTNPIESITKFISKKTKTEVDFRRQKQSGKNFSRFYVKIGKFEFSRK
ncbi:MAG: hypothetical protein JKY09_02810 [Crocinitomicaceae bacterium]|nr:hypothetical protein [Crocinitomicaceae bacterium]